MKGLLTALAILVLIGWAVGYFVYDGGGLFHLIFIVAVIVLVVQLFTDRTT